MGGTEFISLHLVESLLRRGHEVTVFNRGRRQAAPSAGVRTVVGDRRTTPRSPASSAGRRTTR